MHNEDFGSTLRKIDTCQPDSNDSCINSEIYIGADSAKKCIEYLKILLNNR